MNARSQYPTLGVPLFGGSTTTITCVVPTMLACSKQADLGKKISQVGLTTEHVSGQVRLELIGYTDLHGFFVEMAS